MVPNTYRVTIVRPILSQQVTISWQGISSLTFCDDFALENE